MALNYYTQEEYDSLSSSPTTEPVVAEPEKEVLQVEKPKIQYYTEEEYENLGS